MVTSSSFRVVFLVLFKSFGKSSIYHNPLSTITVLANLHVKVTEVPSP